MQLMPLNSGCASMVLQPVKFRCMLVIFGICFTRKQKWNTVNGWKSWSLSGWGISSLLPEWVEWKGDAYIACPYFVLYWLRQLSICSYNENMCRWNLEAFNLYNPVSGLYDPVSGPYVFTQFTVQVHSAKRFTWESRKTESLRNM